MEFFCFISAPKYGLNESMQGIFSTLKAMDPIVFDLKILQTKVEGLPDILL